MAMARCSYKPGQIMANGAEGGHRLNGEAFHRVRNDHEQFLEAYEKPTQIYRFLKSRQTLKPLFLHRNLSYMPRHLKPQRKKIRKKLRVDDLINHARDVKPDLASEIKSDNHLKISFCGIEKGFSFQGLMSDAASQVSAPEEGGKDSSAKEDLESRKKPEHSQLMEVELLLLKFKQSSVHLSESSYPYSCLSLGKQLLKYRNVSSDSENTSQQKPTKGSEQDVSLTIPESVLTWRGNQSSGTQMLVFRASYIKKPVSKPPKRKPLHLINFVSRKGYRKNVAVEVNRLNLAEIGQSKDRKTKHQQQQQQQHHQQVPSNGHGEVVLERRENGYSVSVERLEEEEEERSGADSQEEKVSATKHPFRRAAQHCGTQVVVGNGMSAAVPKVLVEESLSQGVLHSSPTGAPQGKGKSSLSKHGVPQKKSRSKLKKVKTDASVMTEISFGTGNIPDMAIINHDSPLPPRNFAEKSNHSSTPLSSSPPPSNHTQSPPTAKQGYKHKCTSPKLLFRNGTFNGLLNGYALPEVATALKARSTPLVPSKPDSEEEPPIPTQRFFPRYGKGSKTLHRHVNEKTKKKSKLKRHKYPVGTGKRGTRSFLVSFPRVHYDNHPWHSSSASHEHEMDFLSPQLEEGRGKATTHKRRSEIQLLLDGDKPRGQRLSETGIPVFVAEDISNRSSPSSCSINGSNSLRLGSSTRKITPMEHFTYPLISPTKRSPTAGDTPPLASPLPPAAVHGTRKRRNSGGTEDLSVFSSDQPPPMKQSKMAANSGSVKGFSANSKTDDIFEERHFRVDAEMEEVDEVDAKRNPFLNDLPSPPPPPLIHESKIEGVVSSGSGTVFSAELVTFDSRGECLVKDGEYSILMQSTTSLSSSSSSFSSSAASASGRESLGLSTFEPLTWETIFGGGSSNKLRKRREVEECPNLLLKFSMSWLRGPPQHRLCTELNTALDIQKIRKEYFPPLKMTTSPSPPIMFNPSTFPPTKHEPALEDRQSTPLPKPENYEDTKLDDKGIRSEQNGTREDNDHHQQQEQQEQQEQQALLPIGSCYQPSQVSFNFLYSNNSLQQTESFEGLVCPWCDVFCVRIYPLLKHMSLCHPRFHFTYTPNPDGKCVVNVHVNKMYNTGSSSFDRDPGERSNVSLLQRRKGPSKCLSCSAVLVERHMAVKEDLSEFLNDGSWKRGYNINRIYYHSRSCLPMLPKEIEAESEEELQTLQWQNICSQKMIDEFTDVNAGEKELMKLWNSFAMENKVIAEKQVPLSCIKFAHQNCRLLKEKGLVPNFMSHLVNLFDFGLIAPAILRESMSVIFAMEDSMS